MNSDPSVRNHESARAGVVAAAFAAYSNVDYLAVIAAGEAMHANGVSTPVAATITAGIGIAETFGSSYLATKGMGDFTFAPKNKLCQRVIDNSSNVSPLISAWRGAPSGVMLDKSSGREVTARRRLVHSVPYGVALGGWMAAPVTEIAQTAYSQSRDTVSDHPVEAMSAVAIVGAVAAACVVRKLRRP